MPPILMLLESLQDLPSYPQEPASSIYLGPPWPSAPGCNLPTQVSLPITTIRGDVLTLL